MPPSQMERQQAPHQMERQHQMGGRQQPPSQMEGEDQLPDSPME